MISRRASSGVAVLSLAVLVAGCSSSGGGKSSTPPTTGGSGAGPTGTSSSSTGGGGSSAAQAKIASYLVPPTSINITTPLSKKPPTGKTIVLVESKEPVTLETNKGFRAAAAALGWTVKTVDEGTGAEDPSKALNQAIDLKPDAIFVSGQPLSTMRSAVARAKAANIPLFQSDGGEAASTDGSIHTLSIDNFDQTGLWGQLIADYIATKGGKHVLILDLPVYPILHAFSVAVQTELKSVSPSTKTTLVSTQISDLIGGKIPGNTVSQIQRNPDIDWVVVSLGDMSTGMRPALRAAGFTKVHIGGESASTANITALKNKTEDVYTGFAAQIHGWRRIDAAARVFNGDSLDPNNNSKLPTQLITQDNVGTAPIGSDGYYLPVDGYQDKYKALWLVSS